MKKLTTLFITLSLFVVCKSQIIPPSRLFEWEKAGLKQQIQFNDTLYLENFGFVGDGVTDNSPFIQQALNTISITPVVLQIPNGNFYFSDPIQLPSNVLLKGKGSDNTILTFNLDSNETDLISVSGSIEQTAENFLYGTNTGDSLIVLTSNSNLATGDYFQTFKNDSNLITSNWSLKTVGQIVEVKSINGDSIYLDSKLRTYYPMNKTPYIKKINPIKNVGIECLKIHRLDTQTVHCANIKFNYAVNCWVKGVESENCNYSHINFIRSSNVHVSESYFHHAFDYGGGGAGYGVVAMYTSGECLVENNIFEHLRHSMILQGGSNGNVFGYNYSIDPFWTDVTLPSNSAGDMVLHGNYVYANLFEGNIGQNIVIDDSHGANGPHNMFFRNRAQLYGIFMNSGVPTDSSSFIGNEITNNGQFLGFYALFGNGHFEYGNNVKGTVTPTGTNSVVSTSLYCFQKPDFLTTSQFPFCGLPAVYNQVEIPAKERNGGNVNTVCASNEFVKIQSNSNNDFSIFPNPSNSIINFKKLTNITIYNQLGVKVYSSQTKLKSFDLSRFSKGVYLIKTDFDFQKIILK